MVTLDERLADEAIRDWLGSRTSRVPLTAMNSSTWSVSAGTERYVLKISDASEEPCLEVAGWLDERGLRTGAPMRMAVRDGRLVALLRFVDGRPLTTSNEDVEAIGETLGRAHSLLVGAPVPPGLGRWPWPWARSDEIVDADLRDAASAAIRSAERLAPKVTHGILHGDAAPEAYLAGADDVALIDWGGACHGPLLYDVATARMYAGEGVLAAYARTAPIQDDELEAVPVFLAFRWAVQAWYFSDRIRRGDLTGLTADRDNDKGLADARHALLGPPPDAGYCSRVLGTLYPLRTTRLTLRPYETGDLAAIHDLFRREDVCRYLAWEPMDLEQARAKLEQRLGQTRFEADGDPVVLAAVDQVTGRSVGEFMLRLASVASRQGEIGWCIHPDVQGRGLATEGAEAMLRLGFEEAGLHRIVAGCDPRNGASLRVMDHLGMRREAEFREAEHVKGEWIDEIVSAILEAEWRVGRG